MRSTRLVVSVIVCLITPFRPNRFCPSALDCATLVDQALADFGNSCRNLRSGTLCYGHKSVTAKTNSSNSGTFQNPADQVPLGIVERLSTSTVDLTSGEWGLALANMMPADSTTPHRFC